MAGELSQLQDILSMVGALQSTPNPSLGNGEGDEEFKESAH